MQTDGESGGQTDRKRRRVLQTTSTDGCATWNLQWVSATVQLFRDKYRPTPLRTLGTAAVLVSWQGQESNSIFGQANLHCTRPMSKYIGPPARLSFSPPTITVPPSSHSSIKLWYNSQWSITLWICSGWYFVASALNVVCGWPVINARDTTPSSPARHCAFVRWQQRLTGPPLLMGGLGEFRHNKYRPNTPTQQFIDVNILNKNGRVYAKTLKNVPLS